METIDNKKQLRFVSDVADTMNAHIYREAVSRDTRFAESILVCPQPSVFMGLSRFETIYEYSTKIRLNNLFDFKCDLCYYYKDKMGYWGILCFCS